MKIKRAMALVLAVVMLFSINTTAFAVENIGTSEDIHISSFVDGEGKLNTVYGSSEKVGTAHVDYDMDSILVNTVDVEILGLQETRRISPNSAGNVRIKYTDVETSESKVFTDSVSNYITASTESTAVLPGAELAAAATFTYQGRINYNTVYDLGNTYADSLSIYQQAGETTYEYKTINAEKGTAAALVIGVIAAALTVVCPALKVVAADLLYAAAYAAGTTIVGGIIQGAITKQYYTRTTPYKVKARDNVLSREKIYDAEKYQVALSGGGYSSEYYYEGYLPWDTDVVAYWMFCDFWAYSYPGVRSYT